MRPVSAINRFGWGQRDSAREGAGLSLHDWLAHQLTGPDTAMFRGVSSCADGLIALREQRRTKVQGDPLVKPIFQAEVATQMDTLLLTDQPFRERLAWFWFNHFTVSLRQGSTRAVIGAYMREAIRPHVTGRFSDMLLAVMRHPAMLMYLDNASSIGPDSAAGRKSHHGLNENLARECLELHTVSPAAGYSQGDVTSFAAILTGWGVDMKAERPGFVFREKAHEPGPKTLMGQAFPESEDGGVQALHFLGTHPATYRHIATQMVQHFVSDTPSPAFVRHVETVLRDSEGDLQAASLALADLPDPGPGGGKFRSPMDYATAVLRALSIGGEPSRPDDPHSPAHQLASAFSTLGQPLWTAPLPNGWSDNAADWCAPADMLARADWAWRVGSYAPAGSQHPDADLYSQILALNAHDPVTGPAFRNALKARGFSEASRMDMGGTAVPEKSRKPDAFARLSTAAGQMLATPHGPRIAALEIGGWDTHAGQLGRLGSPLAQLDRGIGALRQGLGESWKRTVVLAMTEFGRTVRINGTGGTDHGTGTVAFLAGGAVAGGKVGGTWPGLRSSQLFENRDLAPTTDLRAVAAGVLCDHLHLPSRAVATVFPGPTVDPMTGLVVPV